MNWEPVQSEIENIRYAFQEFLKGRSINAIVKDLHNDMPEVKLKATHKNYRNALWRFDYTGFSLTAEGLELYSKYRNSEIDNLDFLAEQENEKPKYYIKSINYHVQTVSVEDWIIAAKKLRDNKQLYKLRKRSADSDIFSGIINCPYCNLNYYYFNKDSYQYYTHIPSRKCLQRPKSVRREKINKLAEVFYFYYYLVFDDTKKLLEENQKIVDLNLAKIKDKISAVESENRKIERQINNFQSIYEDNSSDKELLKLTLVKEKDLAFKLESNNSIITKLKFELNQLKEELDRDKMELTFYNVKELIISFLETLSIENKRASLIKIIKKCQLFKHYLLIDTGELLFVFDTREDYNLPESIIEEFKNDPYFKDNFVNKKIVKDDGAFNDYIQEFLNTPPSEAVDKYSESDILGIENDLLLHLIIRRLGDRTIQEYYLSKPENREIMEEKLENLGIDYKLNSIQKVVSFTTDI